MNIILTNCTTNVRKGQHINKSIWYREEESEDMGKKGNSSCSLMFLLTEGAQYINNKIKNTLIHSSGIQRP